MCRVFPDSCRLVPQSVQRVGARSAQARADISSYGTRTRAVRGRAGGQPTATGGWPPWVGRGASAIVPAMPTRRFTTLTATVASLALALSASAQAAPIWTPPTDVSTLTDSFGEQNIDVAPSGETVVVVSDGFGAGKYGLRVSLRQPGGTFSEQTLPAGGSTLVAQYPNSAVDLSAGGQGIVAWDQSNGLFYALRSPGGAFGAPQQVTGLPTTSVSSIKAAVDGAGNATFLWTTETGSFPTFTSNVYAIQRRADGTLVNPQTLATLASSEFTLQLESLDVNAAGDAVAAWRDAGPGLGGAHYSLRISPLSPLGGVVNTLNAAGVDGAINEAGDTAVAIATSGGLAVRYKQAGGGLGAATIVGSATSTPDVAIAGDGTATVLWQGLQGSNDVLMACSFTTAGCLQPAETIATDPAAIGGGQLAVDRSGTAVALWSSDPFAAATIRARVRPAGGNWGAEQTVGALKSTYPAVGIDDAGDAVGAWLFKNAGSARTQVSAFDVTPPTFVTVDVPSRAVAGTTTSMSAVPSDNWGPVALSWDFGDGSTASASPASHSYADAGIRTVTITATDASGNATSQTRTITIDPASAPSPPSTGSGGIHGLSPTFTTRPRVLNRLFRVGGRRTVVSGRAAAAGKRVKVGTAFTYALNRAAAVMVTIRGRGVAAKGVRLIRASHSGPNRIAFSGRVGKRALRPGRYRATFIAHVASGATSKAVTVSFTVVKG